jgi:hypothetical protein
MEHWKSSDRDLTDATNQPGEEGADTHDKDLASSGRGVSRPVACLGCKCDMTCGRESLRGPLKAFPGFSFQTQALVPLGLLPHARGDKVAHFSIECK